MLGGIHKPCGLARGKEEGVLKNPHYIVKCPNRDEGVKKVPKIIQTPEDDNTIQYIRIIQLALGLRETSNY